MIISDGQYINHSHAGKDVALIAHFLDHFFKTFREMLANFWRNALEIKRNFLRQTPSCKPIGDTRQNAVLQIDELKNAFDCLNIILA